MIIRDARPSDAPALAALIVELGHDADAATVARHLTVLDASPGDRIVVVEDGGQVIGVAGMHVAIFIHRRLPVARLVTMIVTRRARRAGVGRQLVERIELLARESGCEALELTSREQREDAHRFYDALGFQRTSVRYWKAL